MDKKRFRKIYQAMAAPERLALERLLFMGKGEPDDRIRGAGLSHSPHQEPVRILT